MAPVGPTQTTMFAISVLTLYSIDTHFTASTTQELLPTL